MSGTPGQLPFIVGEEQALPDEHILQYPMDAFINWTNGGCVEEGRSVTCQSFHPLYEEFSRDLTDYRLTSVTGRNAPGLSGAGLDEVDLVRQLIGGTPNQVRIGNSQGCNNATTFASTVNCIGVPQGPIEAPSVPPGVAVAVDVTALLVGAILIVDGPAIETAASVHLTTALSGGATGVNLLTLAAEGEGNPCQVATALTGVSVGRVSGEVGTAFSVAGQRC